jgi:U4/U6.U5 small nuclear ribonucleoproteins
MDAEDEEPDMMAMMGFGGFDSTKVRDYLLIICSKNLSSSINPRANLCKVIKKALSTSRSSERGGNI